MKQQMRVVFLLLAIAVFTAFPQSPIIPWLGYGHDPQHTAVSSTAVQSLSTIHWSTRVDLNPQVSGGDLFIHYGSPIVTAGDTVLVPVKTGATDGFEVEAHGGSKGTLMYKLATDYSLPDHNWTPSYGPVLTVGGRLFYAGAGGTVYYRDKVDSVTGTIGQFAFYGNALYSAHKATFNSTIKISTPLSADRAGNIYFGFIVTGSNPANLTSGIARIATNGVGRWISSQAAAGGDSSMIQPALNCAPVLSNDEHTLYFAVSNGGEFGYGYLISVNSATLAPIAHVELMDPRGGVATVSTDSSASPMVGPDGDVYFGVLENPCCTSHNDRGWMLHFNASLTTTKIPGSFGWDDTASVVPAKAVPSYKGASTYLILSKYNNYVGIGSGDGVNKLAVLDPEASQPDEYSSAPVDVMKEVLTVTAVTADPHSGFPNAVREWCINTAAIDPATKSALVNNEDGVLYRWDFTTNALSQQMRLTNGLGEAYTPTVIGVDGTAYAINDAILFAVGRAR